VETDFLHRECSLSQRYTRQSARVAILQNPKQSAAIVALAADYKLLLDLAGSFVLWREL
jgi:hypothetical protein